MPKIRSNIPLTTFYLFRENPKTGEIEGPFGTGFFVLRASQRAGATHLYAVTNWHVAVDAGASIIRINTAGGQNSRYLKFGPEEWTYPSNGDDLAAIDVTAQIDLIKDHVLGLYEDMFVTEEIIETFSIGLGEDTFMCGLFASHHGGNRNIPVIRFGSLSMFADSDTPVELETGTRMPCHLVDTRSRSGFSGSPVFIYRAGGNADLTNLPYGWIRGWPPTFEHHTDTTRESSGGPQLFWGLLGIHCGQFWDTVEVRKAQAGEKLGDPVKEGDKLRIQSGMTIVVPAWRISKLLDMEDFKATRRKRDDESLSAAENCPRPEAADAPSPPATDADPTHRKELQASATRGSAKA